MASGKRGLNYHRQLSVRWRESQTTRTAACIFGKQNRLPQSDLSDTSVRLICLLIVPGSPEHLKRNLPTLATLPGNLRFPAANGRTDKKRFVLDQSSNSLLHPAWGLSSSSVPETATANPGSASGVGSLESQPSILFLMACTPGI